MEVAIRSIGNSKGVVLPKPLLAQAGLDDQAIAEITVEGGAIILRKPTKPVRVGWAQAAQALAAQGGRARSSRRGCQRKDRASQIGSTAQGGFTQGLRSGSQTLFVG